MKGAGFNHSNQQSSNLLRVFLSLTLSVLFLLPFISAQFGFGFYGFSLKGLIESFLNSSTSVYILIFFALFTVIMLALSRSNLFKDKYGQPNAIAAGTVSFSVSALAVYYIYQSGFQGESLLSWLGLSRDSLGIFVLILVLAIAALMVWKFKFKGLFFVLGLLLILTSLFTDLIYEEGLAMILGLALLLISWWLWRRSKKKERGGGYDYGGYDYPSPQKQGLFDRWKQRRDELSDVRHQARTNYERQKAELDYQKKLHNEEVRRRSKRISEIRDRGEQERARKDEQARIRQEEEMLRAHQEAIEEDIKRTENKIREQERRAEEEAKKQEEAYREQGEREAKRQKQELTERQRHREKERKAGLREINNQMKMLGRQLSDTRISEHSKQVLAQRMRDLENRKAILLRYGVGKGNI